MDKPSKPAGRGGRPRRSLRGLVGLPIVVAALAFLLVSAGLAPGRAASPTLTDRERFGFVAISANWWERFDVAQLRAGWYVDFTQPTCDAAPEGMTRAFVIRVETGYTVDPNELGPWVDNHPGTLWLIGNEPDSIWQDNVLPQEYARIYHDLYAFIKGRDPTSQIAAGSIVQATPLRLEYLDLILAAYQAQYGGAMPVDVWNIHNAILDEKRGSAGAGIPPGISADEGVRRDPQDNDDMTIFADQIWAFRQWMDSRGYGGYPLVVTEYGILMPEIWYGFDAERVKAFMFDAFDFFLNTTDPTLGDPTDGGRLVQRWAWFSLDVPPFDPNTFEGFNGNLFDPETTAITTHGLNYASYTASFPPLSYVDLRPGAFRVPAATTLAGPTQTITRPFAVEVVNGGTVDSGSFTVTLDYSGPVSGALAQAVANAPPAAAPWITFTLANLQPGRYDIFLWLDPDNQVAEPTTCNNSAAAALIAPTHRTFLPLAAKYAIRNTQYAIRNTQYAIRNTQYAPRNTQYAPRNTHHAPPSASPTPGFQEFQVPTADSYPAQIALDAQERVWITERDGNKIARFDPQTGTWEEHNIPTPNSQPWGLALDGAGNVWFAATAANQIMRLDPQTGLFTAYAITRTLDSQPWEVAIGSDGAVWFTEEAGNKIGKLSPTTGVMTEYPLTPTLDAQPSAIVTDGPYVWFLETAANQLGRLDARNGQLIELEIPTPDSRPRDIVVNAQGFPWFTEGQGNQITIFRPATIALFFEIPVYTAASEPYGIALAGDGAIWFTERAAHKLGRYSGPTPPSEYPLPTPGGAPTGIVVDSAGCAWYTAPGLNQIGRLCLPFVRFLPLIANH